MAAVARVLSVIAKFVATTARVVLVVEGVLAVVARVLAMAEEVSSVVAKEALETGNDRRPALAGARWRRRKPKQQVAGFTRRG